MAGCPSSHQPTRIREETLESGEPLQWKLNFRLCTLYLFKIKGQTILNSLMMITYGFAKGKFEFRDRGQLTPSNSFPSTRNSPSTVNNDALPRVMTSCQ